MPLLAAAVFDLLGRISAETTVSGVWNAYFSAALRIGFSAGIVFDLPSSRRLDAGMIADNAPPGWLSHYIAQGYEREDPLTSQVIAARSAFAWTMDDWNDGMTPLQKNWRADNLAAGLSAGLNIGDRSGGGHQVIALGGPRLDIDPMDRFTLHFTGLEALARMREIGLNLPLAISLLSVRETECLNWVAQGKSDWEIGCILSLSEKTVNAHIERAKHKLGAITRAQALVLALRQNLITV
ncbi:MAG TPA: LuxR C-terminal-related transcriptional regulator [Rhizomicrobium sp.]|jgi:LuxR family quorum sensing-dependent transcriptional regulator